MIFDTQEEAVAAAEELRARQVQLIDVGCMQVNLHHHPDAFSSLTEAFDPAANARYAARFLNRLRASAGDWETAIGRYHSSTPGISEGYRARVLAVWSGTSQRSPAEIQRDRVADAWTANQNAESRPRPFTTTLHERPRTSRDPMEQIALLWWQTRQAGGAANGLPVSSRTPYTTVTQQRPLPARSSSRRHQQLGTR